MNSKDIIVRTPYTKYLECIDFGLLQSAYGAGVENGLHLYADYMNSFASGDILEDVAEFLQEQAANLNVSDLVNILDNPDFIFSECSSIFFDAIRRVMGDSENAQEWADDFRKYAHAKFDIFGKYFLFANQYSNAGCERFIIQADSFESAYEILVEEFESSFSTDEPGEDEREDAKMNSNGTYISTDYLSYLGSITFDKY